MSTRDNTSTPDTGRINSLTIRYRATGPHRTRWQVIATHTGTVLAQAQCLEAAHRHASSLERCTLHNGITVIPA